MESVIGSDAALLLKTATWAGVQAAIEQIEWVERDRKGRLDGPIASNPGLVTAIQDFIVGYCIGVAANAIQTNGRNPADIDTDQLLSQIQSRLEVQFPTINCRNIYAQRAPSLSFGLLIGCSEPTLTGDRCAGKLLTMCLTHYGAAPDLYAAEFASSNLRIGYQDQQIIQLGAKEILQRYRNAS